MIRETLHRLAKPAVLAALICSSAGSSAAEATPAQSDANGPDGTPLACNFFFRLKGGWDSRPGVASLDASTDCDSYHIYLANHPTDRARSTFSISETAWAGSLTYHLSDMPMDEVVLLLEPSRQPTRVLARRGSDRINFIVGRVPFTAPPARSLLPRSQSQSTAVARARSSVSSGGSAPAAPRSAPVGTWRAQGVILELHPDGTFARVSNPVFGGFGGVVGMDDSGSYEVHGNQIVLRGMVRERTCSYSQAGQNRLVCNGVAYHKE